MYRLSILALLLLCSCTAAYLPNTRNVPLFGEAQEFSGSVALSSAIDVQTAYSVTDHVAIMANGAILPRKVDEAGVSYNREHKFGEAALGIFGRNKALRYEVYTGYGLGSANSYESFFFFGKEQLVAKGTYQRIFVQPSIGTNNKKFNIFGTVRFSMVGFKEFTTTDPKATIPKYVPTEKFHMFLEPSVTTRFHLAGNLYGFFQLGINAPVPDDVFYDYVPLQGSIGIQVHTGQLRTRVY